MKFNTLVLSSSLLLLSACASQSVDTDAASPAASALSEVTSSLQNNLLASYAAQQLGLPAGKATAALGAIFKTVQGNLSAENFATIGQSIPGLDSIMEMAPEVAGVTDIVSGKSDYLDAAFEQIGVPKETVSPVVNTLTGYLDQNNLGGTADLLKQGLNFL